MTVSQHRVRTLLFCRKLNRRETCPVKRSKHDECPAEGPFGVLAVLVGLLVSALISANAKDADDGFVTVRLTAPGESPLVTEPPAEKVAGAIPAAWGGSIAMGLTAH